MRIDFLSNGLTFKIHQGCLNSIKIEQHRLFEELIQDIYYTVGNVTDSVRCWTDENERYDLHKKGDIIFSPFDLTYSTTEYKKKMANVLVSDLEERGYSNLLKVAYSESLQELEKVIVSMDYEIEYDYGISTEGFLKLLGVRLKDPEGTFTEKLCEYAKTTHNLLKKDFLILINCAVYLKKSEYDVLEEFAKTENVTIMLLNTGGCDNSIDEICEKHIVDNDLCELYL